MRKEQPFLVSAKPSLSGYPEKARPELVEQHEEAFKEALVFLAREGRLGTEDIRLLDKRKSEEIKPTPNNP